MLDNTYKSHKNNYLKDIPFFILGACALIIITPLYFIAGPIFWMQEYKSKKEYLAYLKTIEGTNFFCYNNRKKGLNYIEESLIPNLPQQVEVVFLNGKEIETDKFNAKFLSKAFYGFKHYHRFPHLLKIRDGKPVDCSLNAEVFNWLNLGKNESLIYSKMTDFFQLENSIVTSN